MQTEVLKYLKKHPGSRAVDVAEALGVTPRDIRPALTALKSKGAIKGKGNTRGKTWTAKS
jgi:predicted ArsR family transcriptional regulator